jgi:hypothetical protein
MPMVMVLPVSDIVPMIGIIISSSIIVIFNVAKAAGDGAAADDARGRQTHGSETLRVVYGRHDAAQDDLRP